MLEESINALTAAVLALTYAMNQRASQDPVAASLDDIKPAIKEPKAKKVEPVAQVPNVPTPSATATDTSPSSEPESAPVSYDDVKKATNALSAAKGRDVTIDALSRFGVKRATELDEGQWADYISYANRVTADA